MHVCILLLTTCHSVSTIMSSQQYIVGDAITMWLMSRQKVKKLYSVILLYFLL